MILLSAVLTLSLAPGASANAADTTTTEATATFAAGCFWCIQSTFDKTPGVIRTTVGYTGGPEQNPTYKQVASGLTGHAEAIEVIYDPKTLKYEELLEVFWQNIDPLAENKQFPDEGPQYRTVIFYHNQAQHLAAVKSLRAWEKDGRFGGPIVTQIVAASRFWPAEEYHQQYYKKSPQSYKAYNDASGRNEYFKKMWGK